MGNCEQPLALLRVAAPTLQPPNAIQLVELVQLPLQRARFRTTAVVVVLARDAAAASRQRPRRAELLQPAEAGGTAHGAPAHVGGGDGAGEVRYAQAQGVRNEQERLRRRMLDRGEPVREEADPW